jgi:transposase
VWWTSRDSVVREGASVVVAHTLAIILHRIWIDGTEFNWSKKEIAA